MSAFCTAPFFHLHIDVDGSQKLCCLAKSEKVEEKFKADLNLSPEEFWNSSYMQDRREKMLHNNPPPECELCIHSNRNASYNNHFNTTYPDPTKGSAPVDFDVRVPLCNLSCRICGPNYSTAILGLYQRNKAALETAGIHVPSGSREVREKTTASFLKFIRSGKVQRIYFAGGEPTLAPNHLDSLDELARCNPRAHVLYSTNLSMKSEFVEQWLPRLAKLKNVSLQCSLDGVGELGEYLREGLSFAQFEKNLAILKEKAPPHIFISIDATVTSLGALDISSLARFALKHKVKLFAKFMVGGPATHLRPESLSLDERKLVQHSFDFFYRFLNTEEQWLVSDMKMLLDRLPELPAFTPEEQQEAGKHAELFDKLYPDRKAFAPLFREKKDSLTKDS